MRTDAGYFSVKSIDTCKLAFAAGADQAGRQRFLQGHARVFECAPVNANPNRRHFLLFAPCNCLAVVVVTLHTQSLLTAHFCNHIAVVSNDMMFETILIAAASVHFIIDCFPTFFCGPFALVNASNPS